MHEINGEDKVLLMEGHPLSGMGNWHNLGETVDWNTNQDGLRATDVRRVLGVDEWSVESVDVADARQAVDLAEYLARFGVNPDVLGTLADLNLLALPKDAIIDGHQGIACGTEPPHYFPTRAYGILQNEELLSLAEMFQEAAHIERGVRLPILSAGTLRSRRMAFVSVGIPDDPALDGLPARNHAMNLGTSHDGTCALIGCLASYIVVCANTFRASLLGSAPQEIKVKHTRQIEDLAEARAVLRGMLSTATATDRAIARLLDQRYDAGALWSDLEKAVFPQVYAMPDDSKGWTAAHTKAENRLEAIQDVYYSPEVPTEARGNAWGALMAVQGWEQHHRTTRTSKGKQPRNRAAVAIQRTVAASTADTGYPLSDALMRTPVIQTATDGRRSLRDLVNS